MSRTALLILAALPLSGADSYPFTSFRHNGNRPWLTPDGAWPMLWTWGWTAKETGVRDCSRWATIFKVERLP